MTNITPDPISATTSAPVDLAPSFASHLTPQQELRQQMLTPSETRMPQPMAGTEQAHTVKDWLPTIGLGALGLISGGIAYGHFSRAQRAERAGLFASTPDEAAAWERARKSEQKNANIFGALSGVSIGASILLVPKTTKTTEPGPGF